MKFGKMIRKISTCIITALVALIMITGIIPASEDTNDIWTEFDTVISPVRTETENYYDTSDSKDTDDWQKYISSEISDIVTIYDDMTIEVITEEGCYIKIKPPFGMIALTQDLAASWDSYVVQHEEIKYPRGFIGALKKNNVHIYLKDLVNGTRIAVSLSRNTGEYIHGQEINLGENTFSFFDSEKIRRYEYLDGDWIFCTTVQFAGEELDEFDIKNVEKMLSGAVMSAKAGN